MLQRGRSRRPQPERRSGFLNGRGCKLAPRLSLRRKRRKAGCASGNSRRISPGHEVFGGLATLMKRLAQLRRSLEDLFPERHLYVRSGGEMKGYVLTPRKQMMAAGGVAAAALWMGVCSAAMLVNMLSASSAD